MPGHWTKDKEKGTAGDVCGDAVHSLTQAAVRCSLHWYRLRLVHWIVMFDRGDIAFQLGAREVVVPEKQLTFLEVFRGNAFGRGHKSFCHKICGYGAVHRDDIA